MLSGIKGLMSTARGLWQRASASWSLSQLHLLMGGISRVSRYEATQPMAQITTAYACITAIAQTLAGMKMAVHTGDAEQPLKSGPAHALLHNPAPGVTWPMLCEQIAGHLVESGEAHLFDSETRSLDLKRIDVFGARQMSPEIRNGRLLWWWYTPHFGGQRVPVLPEVDACLRLFNPYDPIRGLSPLKAATLEMRQSYAASVFNALALENGGAPGGLWTVPGQLTPDEKKELTESIKKLYESPENANRSALGWGGLDYKSVAFKNIDLDLRELKKFSREEICSVLGVPPVLAGLFEAAHYDVADQAIVIFLIHKLAPLARSIEAVVNLQILPRVQPGAMLAIDTSDHPAMLALIAKRIDAMRKAIENGTPYNEAGPLVGLMVKPQPWGNTSLIAGGLTTVEDVIAGTRSEPEGEGGDDDGEKGEKGEKEGGEQQRTGWKPVPQETAGAAQERREEARQTRAAELRIRPRILAHLARQERLVVARVKRVIGEAKATHRLETGATKDHLPWKPVWERAGSAEEELAIEIMKALDQKAEANKLKGVVRNYFPASIEKALREKLAGLGLDGAELDKMVRRLMDGRTIKSLLRNHESNMIGLERTTRKRIYRTMVEGLTKQETVSELSERVREAVRGVSQYRVNRIARTEAGQAVSTGRFLAMSTAGAKGKIWLTGSNPRSTHIAAGAKYATPIAMDEPFLVGDSKLMFPRDPRGSAQEIINCNCVLIAARLKTKEEDRRDAGATRSAA